MDLYAEMKRICDSLNQNGIRYCIAEWWEKSGILEIFIHPDYKTVAARLFASMGYKEFPFRKEHYSFIYRMIPDAFWKAKGDLILHSACQMSCISLSNLSNCILPLDESIQQSIWNEKYLDPQSGNWVLSKEDRLIHLVTGAIFNDRQFNEDTIVKIGLCNANYDSSSLRRKLEGVFFKFTPHLIEYLKNGNYDEIIHAYRTFRDY